MSTETELRHTGTSPIVRQDGKRGDIRLFTDGGLIGRNPSADGLTWAWCRVENGVRVDEDYGWLRASELPMRPETGLHEATSNQAEFLAALQAFEALAPGEIVHVYTDSAVTIKRWAEMGALHGIPVMWRVRMNACLKRHGGSFWHHVDGHPSKADLERGRKENGDMVSEHNVYVDALTQLAVKVARLCLESEREHGLVMAGGRE